MSRFRERQTQNLFSRELADTDAEDLLSIHGDAQHMKWFGPQGKRSQRPANLSLNRPNRSSTAQVQRQHLGRAEARFSGPLEWQWIAGIETKIAAKWLAACEKGEQFPTEKLDEFLDFYRKVKDAENFLQLDQVRFFRKLTMISA